MDPSQYQFTPNSVIPQESKLATYMNRPSLSSSLISPPSTSGRKDYMQRRELQSTFYSNLDITASRDSSSMHMGTQLSNPQISVGQMGAAQLGAVQLNANQINAAQISAAQMAAQTQQILQENVGGTTYFYPTTSSTDQASISQQQTAGLESQSSLLNTSSIGEYNIPTFYPRTSTEVNPHQAAMRPGLSSYYLPEDVREEIMLRNEITHIQPDPVLYPEMPARVENYVELMPLEGCSLKSLHSCYRAVHSVNDNQVILRRLHDFRLSTTTCPTSIEKWKYLQHPNVVRLREVFTTKVFGDTSLIFVFDFHAASLTLAQQYTLHTNENGPSIFGDFSSDPDAPRPYSHQKNSLLRAVHGTDLLPESTIWSLLIQLTAALKNIHSSGLACRNLDPSKVIMTGNRLRLAWCGVDEIAGAIGGGSGAVTTDPDIAQQEDLTSLGKLVLFLACRTVLPLDLTQSQVQYIMRTYSQDLKNLLLYLLTMSPRRSVIDLMPMIGARFYTHIETLERRVDNMESELATEIDNTRLLNILVKLCTVNERPDLNMDVTWAETGERYMLKLFRDYLFHAVTPDGKPWLDYSYLVYNLNQLDAGTHNKLQLMSRDHKITLIVSYADLKRALELSYAEVKNAASPDS